MDAVSLLGLAAAIMTSVSFLPQVIKVLKTNDTRSLSLSMYAVFVSGVACWLLYGIFKQDIPIILANAFTLLLSSLILIKKLMNLKHDKLSDA